MENYPKISVITPVKNCAETFEKAIQSVIAQNYSNLEYIVIDGGSTDGTLDIIKKYEKYIDYWHSKADGGSVLGSIEGLKKASGEIINFLNADDFFENGALIKAGQEFAKDPALDLVSLCYRVFKNGKIVDESTRDRMELDKNKIITSYGINARFFKKSLFDKYGLMMTQDDKNRVFLSNDIEHLIRILLKGINSKSLDFIGYNYLAHEKSNTFATNLNTKIRLHEDKIFIAKRFLNSAEFDLPPIWKKTFKKWLLKHRASVVKLYLQNFNLSEGLKEAKLGVKDNGRANFYFYLLKSFFRKN